MFIELSDLGNVFQCMSVTTRNSMLLYWPEYNLTYGIARYLLLSNNILSVFHGCIQMKNTRQRNDPKYRVRSKFWVMLM